MGFYYITLFCLSLKLSVCICSISTAFFFFGLMGVNEWIVVFAATLQWLLNIFIPVCIGSYFVFRFKPAEATPH